MDTSFSQSIASIVRNDYDLGNVILTFLNVDHVLVEYEEIPISKIKIDRYSNNFSGLFPNIKTRIVKTNNSFKPSDMDEFLD